MDVVISVTEEGMVVMSVEKIVIVAGILIETVT